MQNRKLTLKPIVAIIVLMLTSTNPIMIQLVSAAIEFPGFQTSPYYDEQVVPGIETG